MPHAALCVSRHRQFRGVVRNLMKFQCRTQHCVCRDEDGSRACDGLAGFNAARSIVCVETCAFQRVQCGVSMPHAALCVSRPSWVRFTSRAQLVSMPHAALCVSRQQYLHRESYRVWFQCRTQHCVCRDAVSRSPCPARAEKAFWKDALFCAVFGVCG